MYSVYLVEEQMTLFDVFLYENKNSFKSELKDISGRIYAIGHNTGAREQFFKLKEGNPGDGVCALYDDPDIKLRLYCIRFGADIVILGGGGEKNVRALQDDPKLKKENSIMRQLSSEMMERIKDGEIAYTVDYLEFEGDLEFDI